MGNFLDDHTVFEAFAPPPTMIIFGAVDFSAALARVAKVLGFHSDGVRCRPRSPPGSPLRIEVVVDWRTATPRWATPSA